jgi:hypothetical protein
LINVFDDVVVDDDGDNYDGFVDDDGIDDVWCMKGWMIDEWWMMSDDSGPMTERDILNMCRNEIVQQKQETRNKNLSPT